MVDRGRLAMLAVTMGMLAASPAALAQTHDWRFMADVGAGENRFLLFIDAASLASPTPDTRQLMVATYDYALDERTSNGAPFNVVRITYGFDCKARTTWKVKAELFDEDRLVELEPPNRTANPAEPGTIAGDVFDAACTRDFAAFPRISAPSASEERRRRFKR